MSSLKIEKKVAMPDKSARGAKPKYPFRQMKPGDSFAVPSDLKTKITVAASQHGLRNDQKFSVLRTEKGYRCWRVK